MIFGLPKLYGYLGIALAAVLAFSTAYFKGRSDGKAVVQAVLDEQRAVWQADFDKQVAETALVQAAWNSSEERQREIAARLQVVTTDSADLAERLRQHTRRRVCAVSGATAAAAGTGTAGRVAGDSDPVEVATGQHFAACARDAERLTQFQSFYQSLRDSQ